MARKETLKGLQVKMSIYGGSMLWAGGPKGVRETTLKPMIAVGYKPLRDKSARPFQISRHR